MSDIHRRLTRLELIWPKPSCPVCFGRPSRVVTIDPVTDEELSETMPADGCPACGALIFRQYVIVDDDVPLRLVP